MARRTCSTPIPDSPTFGALLATFTLPDPDAAHQAQFGAAVAAANTNVVIGAPGKDGGSGEVYVFEGDPTQPTFGRPAARHRQPGRPGRRRFGAAVAGIGGNLIVGAPFDNTAGTGAGIVYLFRRHDRRADRGDRQPASGGVDRLRHRRSRPSGRTS